MRKKNMEKIANQDKIQETASNYLAEEAGPTGIEPATPGLKVRCSSLTELRTRKDSLRLIGKHEGVF
jgi:hypothetical protein